jgi:plasmid stabilization system protein ParE
VTSSRVDLSEEAKGDLRDIEDWIVDHDGEMRAAAALERIWKAIYNLAFMPGIGRRGHSYLEAGSRVFPVPPWTIIYQPLPEDGGIFVQRILDGRRDLAAIFKKKSPRR